MFLRFSASKLVGFKSGSEDAFKKVYSHFRRPILNFVSTRVRDDEAAEEITQEIFLKVYRSRDLYSEDYAFSTWLWTIARNTVFDSLRERRGEGVADGEIHPEELACKVPLIETVLGERQQRKRLFQKLASALTRPQRRVLWLRVARQLSYDEIARKLGLSLSAVKNLAYRANRILAETAPDSEWLAWG